MKILRQWKFILPVVQLAVAICLWLYIPVQFRKDVLHARHLPTDHPYRYRLPHLAPEQELAFSPPSPGMALRIINFPAFAVSHGTTDKLLAWYERRNQSALPRWEFTLPIRDPEALPPARIFYVLTVYDLCSLTLIILLWFWIGYRIDDYLRTPDPSPPRWRTPAALAEVVVVALVALLSTTWSYAQITHPHSYHHLYVGIVAGLIWPTVLLGYVLYAIRKWWCQRSTAHGPA